MPTTVDETNAGSRAAVIKSATEPNLHAAPHISEATDHPLQGGDPGLVMLRQPGCLDLLVELAALVLGDPDPDQIPAELVPLDERVEPELAGQILLDDLPREGERVGAMPCHDSSSWPSQHVNSDRPICPPAEGHSILPYQTPR